MKKTISLFILLSVLGCNNDEAEKAVGDPVKYLQREEVRLSQTGAFSVPCAFSNVDDLRDLGVYTDTEGREIFYLCDDASMAKAVKVYFFDWQTKEPLDTLVLPSEGPYQISEGARIYNLGVSVFENELVAWDALAGKFLRYSLENKRKAAEVFYWSTDNSKLYKPVIACRFPLTKFDQDRYILPIGMGVYNFVGSNVRTDLSSILKIKLTKPNKEVIEEQGILPFPPIYEKGFFTLAPQLYASSYVIDGDNLLASFPLDSKIYIKSLTTNEIKIRDVVSQKIDTTSIKPLRSAQWMEKALKGETNPIDVNESALYGWNLDTYTGLVGLPDQDVFIRLVDITPEQTSVHFDPLDTDFEYDKTSVMILGKNLNVLNEHFIDTPENSNYAYFTKDNTIYFLNDPESEADENRLYFNEFKVVGL